MLKDRDEREHCIVLGPQGAWWGGERGDTVPKATSSCLAEFGKEGGESSCFGLEEQNLPLPSVRVHSMRPAVLKAALPAPALNLNLVAERMLPTRFLGVEGDNQARPYTCLGCSLLQGSS